VIRRDSLYNFFWFSVITIVVSIAIYYTSPIFLPVENIFIDLRFSLRGREDIQDRVFIVAIDESSEQEIGEWRWDRRILAELIENIESYGPSVVALDIVLDREDRQNPESDSILSGVIKKYNNVILPAFFRMSGYEGREPQVVFPAGKFMEASAGIGCINLSVDSDGQIRWCFKRVRYGDQELDSMPYAILKQYFKKDISIPDRFLINYSGDRRYIYPAYCLLKEKEECRFLDKKNLKDKIVLIGFVNSLRKDDYSYPVFDEERQFIEDITPKRIFGVEIFREMVNTVLQNRYIREPEGVINFGIIFLMVVIGGIFSFTGPLKGIIGGVICILFYSVVNIYLFIEGRYLIQFVSPVIAVPVGFITVFIYRFYGVESDRFYIRKVLKSFMSEELLKEIDRSYKKIKIGGQRRYITVLFSDIRGFTSLSEKMSPEDVVKFLNRYIGRMTDIIFQHKGIIDKYIGDGIMAIWGPGIEQSKGPLLAVRCAVEMQRALMELNREPEFANLKIGVGISYGEAVVGIIGSLKKMEYTSIGDTVNVASRVEDLTKNYGCQIILTEDVFEMVKSDGDLRGIIQEIGEVEIRGRVGKKKLYGIKI
jgi:adenylate cyclase